nr:3-hydroxyacyl-CoA dehydrogenase NAD-binding domain-containing protein [Sinobaca sp. H24]
MTIQHVSVMGSGVMGSQIGLVAALAGFNVHIYDVKQEPFEKAQQELLKRLDRQVEKGKLALEDKEAAWDG